MRVISNSKRHRPWILHRIAARAAERRRQAAMASRSWMQGRSNHSTVIIESSISSGGIPNSGFIPWCPETPNTGAPTPDSRFQNLVLATLPGTLPNRVHKAPVPEPGSRNPVPRTCFQAPGFQSLIPASLWHLGSSCWNSTKTRKPSSDSLKPHQSLKWEVPSGYCSRGKNFQQPIPCEGLKSSSPRPPEPSI